MRYSFTESSIVNETKGREMLTVKITKVKLYAYDLHKMKEFYSTQLGFSLIKIPIIILLLHSVKVL